MGVRRVELARMLLRVLSCPSQIKVNDSVIFDCANFGAWSSSLVLIQVRAIPCKLGALRSPGSNTSNFYNHFETI